MVVSKRLAVRTKPPAGHKALAYNGQVEAWKHMSALLGKSYKVLDRELTDKQIVAVLNDDGSVATDARGRPKTITIGGNWQVAQFVISRMTGSGTGLLLKDVTADISSMDGVMQAAEEVVAMMLTRKMTISDAQKALGILIQYAAIRAYSGVQELKQLLEDLNMKTINGAQSNPFIPKWGNLSVSTPTANKTAAE